MFEDRVIRFSALEASSSLGPKTPQARLDDIREACRSVVARLPPTHRSTLVLLSAADIENGILKRLLDCHLQSATETEDLAEQIIEGAEREPNLLLAICMSQESLQAWDAPRENSRKTTEEAAIKDKEFLIRLFTSYQLGFTIPGVRNRDADAFRIRSQIERSLKALNNAPRVDNWRERLQSLKQDIQVLTDKVFSLLSAHVIKNFDSNSSGHERNARFLHVISRLDQFGKRPVGNIMWSIGRDIEKPGLRMLDDYQCTVCADNSISN
jgi:hypothetical protein